MFYLFFLNVRCTCIYFDVAYIWHICCKCFIWMLPMFYMVFKCFSCIFASVSYACFKCFICLQIYIASVASGCFKSRSGVAHVAMCMRSEGVASGPHAWSSGIGPAWACETQARTRACWRERGRASAWETKCSAGVQTRRLSGRPSTSTTDIF